jgi:RHS repeat-associated protein
VEGRRTYTYDPVGNRLTETSDAGTTTFVYDDADRLMSTTAPGNVVTSYTFDANGNQIAAGSESFTYDLADRLATATIGSTTETYTYAGDGVRLSASTGSQAAKTTKFLWDRSFGLPQLALERNGHDALLRDYRYGLDLLSQQAGNKTYLYHYDGLGSVTDVTGSTGSSVWWSDYYPYGALRTQGKAGGGNGAPAVQPFNFAGEQLDAVTGLYHLRARQYDPGTGRFLTTDPAVVSAVDPYVGAYVYATDRPTLLVDPSGRDSQGACINFNFGVGPAQVGLEACAVQTSSGQGGVTLTFGGGAGANLDVTAGAGYQYSTADTFSDLGGPFGGAGGSVAVGIGGYGNVSGGTGRCPGKITNVVNAGVSVGGGASVSANGTYTIPIQLFGPPDPPCFARPLK